MTFDFHKLLHEIALARAAPDAAFASAFYRLTARMERYFARMEDRAEQAGLHGAKDLREQHALLLSALHHLVGPVSSGDTATARELLEHLPHWLVFHSAVTPKPACTKRLRRKAFDSTPSRTLRPNRCRFKRAESALTIDTITGNRLPC